MLPIRNMISHRRILAAACGIGLALAAGSATAWWEFGWPEEKIVRVRCDWGQTVENAIKRSSFYPSVPLVILISGACDEEFLEIERDKLTLQGVSETARLNAQIGVDGARDFQIIDLEVSGPLGVSGAGTAFVTDYGDRSPRTVIERGITIGAASFIEIEGGVQIGSEPIDTDGNIFRANLNATASATELGFLQDGQVVFATPEFLGNIELTGDSNLSLTTEEWPGMEVPPVSVHGDIVCDSDSRVWSNDLDGVTGEIHPNCRP